MLRPRVLVVFQVLAWPLAGWAQPPNQPPEATAPAFVIQGDNGDNRLQLGAIVQFDGRFTPSDEDNPSLDTFTLRRFRAVTQGRVARHFDYFLNVDFAGGNVNVRDAYFDTTFSRALRIRVGKMKAPFSYDRNILIVNTLFVERGLTTAVAPDRDTGVQVLGDLAGNRVTYGVSLTNGVADGGSGEVDANDGKDLTARIVVRPWVRDVTRPLSGLGIALAGSTGAQGGGLPSFQSSGRQTFFAYDGAVGVGRRTRVSPQAFFYRGRVGGYAEYVRSSGDVTKGGVARDIDHEAWQVAGSWVLTGEPAGERNVRPRVSFDPPSGHFGALQATVRVQQLSVSREALTRELATRGSSRRARVWTLGVNWYLNSFIKWNLNFDRTDFEGDAGSVRHAENAILLRGQLAF
jgi:phosphate-selective porin OprO and OprP